LERKLCNATGVLLKLIDVGNPITGKPSTLMKSGTGSLFRSISFSLTLAPLSMVMACREAFSARDTAVLS
jgi:hypothetical protein